MKKILLSVLLSGYVLLTLAQDPAASTNMAEVRSLTKLDLNFVGIGFTYEPRLAKFITLELSTGAAGGYRIAEGSFEYISRIGFPAFYFSANPKFFYNRQRRVEKGRKTLLNAGNYLGLKAKYTTPSVAPDNMENHALLVNLHWGMQRAIGRRWTINTHFGFGYGYDLATNSGAVYPAIDLHFSYVLSKINK
jgi:hypothetical protein